MLRVIALAAGDTYIVTVGSKLVIQRIIFSPTAPGTDMTLTTANHEAKTFTPTIKSSQLFTMEGPFIIQAFTSNATISPAAGAVMLVGAEYLPQS